MRVAPSNEQCVLTFEIQHNSIYPLGLVDVERRKVWKWHKQNRCDSELFQYNNPNQFLIESEVKIKY